MVWKADDPQGNEAGKVRWDIVPYTRGTVLDLGCGPNKAFGHFLGIDSGKDTELFGITMRPDLLVKDCADLSNDVNDACCDAIFSSHLLEHIVDYRAALKDWWRCLKPGGHLCLYLPHKDFYPNIGTPHANKDHKHDFLPIDIMRAMMEVAPSWDCVVNEERNGGTEYSFLQIYRKTDDGHFRVSAENIRPEKTACVVRYGAIGDVLQMSSLLPGLKAQGFHVTVMTTPKGQGILDHDPHVDAWIIQDDNQVPNAQLGPYWATWAKKFDRFVNLSESVEGTLLAVPGRINHAWPDALRHKHMNVNYLEFTHDLAQIPLKPAVAFYETADEKAWAAGVRADFAPDDFLILWVLAGSSLHKTYPWTDAVMAQILVTCPKAKFILAGDDACQMLEAGWEAEPRVMLTSGQWSIRETLAMANQVNLVIGPETGVLNAVSCRADIAKIVFLSHSSVENLSRDWRNTKSLFAHKETVCKTACHRLHYTSEHCHEHPESGTAMCQALIDPDKAAKAMQDFYTDWQRLHSLKLKPASAGFLMVDSPK